MATFRVEKTTGYTVMSNHHLRNKNLTLKAKGLLSLMLSLPEEWDYTLRGLACICRESVDAVRSGIGELEKEGYIVRGQLRDGGRFAAADYTIYEAPQLAGETGAKADTKPPENTHGKTPEEAAPENNGFENVGTSTFPPLLDFPISVNPIPGNPTSENPVPENPTSGNPTQINKELLNKNILIQDPNHIPSLSQIPGGPDEEPDSDREGYSKILKKNLCYDRITDPRLFGKSDRDFLEGLYTIALEALLSQKKKFVISGNKHSAEYVRKRLLKLEYGHLLYVKECFDNTKSRVVNVKAYLLMALINAPLTMDAYYTNRVTHDLYKNKAY